MARASEKRVGVRTAQPRRDWSALIRSIRRGRAPSARFFKPVCVIAAIDLADRGRLVSDLLHSELIVRQFADYVEPFFPERASSGWQPLWFLSNDGLWTFFRKGKPLDRTSFENGMPRTKKKLVEKFDTQLINPSYKQLWDMPAARKELRDQMLLMLDADPETRVLVAPLLDPDRFGTPENWPDAPAVAAYLDAIRGQYDLFGPSSSSVADTPAPDRAARARAALAEFDVAGLPPATAAGPEFAVTGTDPVTLSPKRQDVETGQQDLYLLLRAKSSVLERAVPASTNRAAQLRVPVAQFAAAVRPELAAANGHIIWSHGNTLRRLNDADLRARSNGDPDIEPLPEDIGELLSDLVEQFNAYAQHDALMRHLDHARIGPAGRAELLERLQAGRNLVAAAQQAPLVMAPDATEILVTATRTADAAIESVGLNADQAIVNTADMQRNGASAIVRSAVLEFKRWFAKSKRARRTMAEGALKEAGAETIKQLPFLQFINRAAEFLRAMWRGQDGETIIDRVLDWIGHIGS